MARYGRCAARAPRADWIDDDYPLIPAIMVDDSVAVDTGLVWNTGEPIMRLQDPIGFGDRG